MAYIWMADTRPGFYQLVAPALAAAGILFVHYFFWHHYIFEAEPDPFYWFTGPDQLVLFGHRYWLIKRAVLVFAAAALLWT